MLAFDGKAIDLNDEDKGRRNLIVKLLQEWDLVDPIQDYKEPMANISMVKVIPSKDKENWKLLCKYTIGKK